LVHERHELVGKSGHCATDTDAADIWATANAAHPSELADIALDDRSPTAKFDNARFRSIGVREFALLIIAAPIAALMKGFRKQPGRSQLLIERDHRHLAGSLLEQVEQCLHKTIGMNRTARNVDDRDSGLRSPLPAKVVGEAHCAGRIAFHGVNPAIRRAGAGADYRPCFGREPVYPFTRRDRLAGPLVGTERSPVAFRFVFLVWDRAFDDQDERIDSIGRGIVEKLDKILAIFVGQELVMKMDLRYAWDTARDEIFDARLRRGSHSDGIAVAAETGRYPENVNFCKDTCCRLTFVVANAKLQI
jgi:hypothetical protein